ncbi:LLM class flavin-dependent oxidoreductase [Streptomyces sp. NPDC051662]|uniref:LLM class flavin-dependent oxidoreductase n=1 Tax=Streptomyces sp. NPDC051662 TaxID=3154750 RepID=UPI003434BD70
MRIHGDVVRFGVHSGQQYESFGACLELWQRAEELGYDWVSLFDHMRPPLGGPGGPCLEGPTLLAGLAARTQRIRCGLLVLAVPNRHPASMAAIAATLDHVSGGRLELGLGSGGPDLMYDQFGWERPAAADRAVMLDETCRILRSMWTLESTDFHGHHYHLRGAHLAPKPLQSHVPLVLGGSGAGVLRAAARHADIWNTLPGTPEAYRRLCAALDDQSREAGRELADIRQSITFRAVLAEDENEARRRREALLGHLPPDSPLLDEYLSFGTPEQCVADLARYAALGVRDFILGARPPIDWTTVELVATRVAPALRRVVVEGSSGSGR